MSRIGKLPVSIPEKVEVSVMESQVKVKGPLGELEIQVSPLVSVKKVENEIIVTKSSDEGKALWGTTRSILSNMVEGVTQGFKKTLVIKGVGYKFEVAGQKLTLSIGYSHKVDMQVPEGIKVALDEKDKNTLYVTGIDKQQVGEYASKIRAKKKPEPYKGKGIAYKDEYIRRKAGKTGK